MKKILIIQLLFYNSLIIFSQPAAIQWEKCLGGTGMDYGKSVKQTSDGGYIVAGQSTSNNGDVTGNHGNYDYWVAKLDSLGAIQWQKSLGGTSMDEAFSIQQTTDGGYIVAGEALSNNGDVTGNHGQADYWIVKLDDLGVIQWQKSLGGTGMDIPQSIVQTTDGGYIIAGLSNSNNGDVTGNHGGFDFWVVKLDNFGIIQWQKSIGGTGVEKARTIEETADGGYIVAGESNFNNGDVTGNHGNDDCWVVKLSNIGAIQWQKSLGGTSFDYGVSIHQTTDLGYIVAGQTESNNGDVSGNHGGSDYWVVKLANLGTIQWQKCLGGSAIDIGNSIDQTIDGGYIVVGNSDSTGNGDPTGNHGDIDLWVVKLDSSGTTQWQKCLGGVLQERGYSVQQTLDGGYIIVGDADSTDGDVTGNHCSQYGSTYDYWIVKLAPTPFVWPGDADNNSIVNNNDLLPIGLYYGQTGTLRSSISNLWQAEPSTNWGFTETNGADIKNADCNGDGAIDANDTLAINLNFNLTHSTTTFNNFNNERLTTSDIYFVTSGNTYNAGDWVDIELWLGDLTTPVTNLYGIAFNINYDASLVQPGTESISYPSGWLGNPGTNALKISKIDALSNSAYGAFTRINHTNASGYGKIADFKFQIKNPITSAAIMHLSISNYSANNATGAPQIFTTSIDSISINSVATGLIEVKNTAGITIYPNPFTSNATIAFDEIQRNTIIKIIDVLGKEIKSISFIGKELIIEKGELEAGIYFVQIIDGNKNVVNRKIMIQ